MKFLLIFSVEHSPGGPGAPVLHAQELVDFPYAEIGASSSTEIDNIPSNRMHLTSVESSKASTSTCPHTQDEITSTSGGVPLQNSSALVESNRTGQSGISMFQRYSFLTYMHVAAFYLYRQMSVGNILLVEELNPLSLPPDQPYKILFKSYIIFKIH